MEKPPELVAFDTGREVMEQLRSKHASVSLALESLCAEIGMLTACWLVSAAFAFRVF